MKGSSKGTVGSKTTCLQEIGDGTIELSHAAGLIIIAESNDMVGD